MFKFRLRASEASPVVHASPQAAARPQPLQLLIDRGEPFFEPYGDPATDWRYNLVFCDIPLMFQGSAQTAAGKPWAPVFDPASEPDAILKVAQDQTIETPLRLLAYHRLRAQGVSALASDPLAMIIEMPQARGLDTLAIYAGGMVRYINQSRAGLDNSDPACRVGELALTLMSLAPDVLPYASHPVERREPPPHVMPQVRISALTSDGCHVLEGTEESLEANSSVRAVLRLAGVLVEAVLEKWRGQHDATKH